MVIYCDGSTVAAALQLVKGLFYTLTGTVIGMGVTTRDYLNRESVPWMCKTRLTKKSGHMAVRTSLLSPIPHVAAI